eukprot:COSAG01_NODE_2440_length_7691_cov_12.311249_6_plen_684_part_00
METVGASTCSSLLTARLLCAQEKQEIRRWITEEHGSHIVPKVVMNKMDLLRSDKAKVTQVSERREALSLLRNHHPIFKNPSIPLDSFDDGMIIQQAIDLVKTPAYLAATVNTEEQEQNLVADVCELFPSMEQQAKQEGHQNLLGSYIHCISATDAIEARVAKRSAHPRFRQLMSNLRDGATREQEEILLGEPLRKLCKIAKGLYTVIQDIYCYCEHAQSRQREEEEALRRTKSHLDRLKRDTDFNEMADQAWDGMNANVSYSRGVHDKLCEKDADLRTVLRQYVEQYTGEDSLTDAAITDAQYQWSDTAFIQLGNDMARELVSRLWSWLKPLMRGSAEVVATGYNNHLREVVQQKCENLLKDLEPYQPPVEPVTVATMCKAQSSMPSVSMKSIVNKTEKREAGMENLKGGGLSVVSGFGIFAILGLLSGPPGWVAVVGGLVAGAGGGGLTVRDHKKRGGSKGAVGSPQNVRERLQEVGHDYVEKLIEEAKTLWDPSTERDSMSRLQSDEFGHRIYSHTKTFWRKHLHDTYDKIERQLAMLLQSAKQAEHRLEKCLPLRSCLQQQTQRLVDLESVFRHYIDSRNKAQFDFCLVSQNIARGSADSRSKWQRGDLLRFNTASRRTPGNYQYGIFCGVSPTYPNGGVVQVRFHACLPSHLVDYLVTRCIAGMVPRKRWTNQLDDWPI